MKALIIEDEDIVAQELKYKIGQIDSSIEIVDVISSLKRARAWFMENAEPDLLFMDIHLSDGLSFELFETFKLQCPIIFTTAHDEYAVRAFKVNSVDYLLKPIDESELEKAIAKAKQIIQSKQKSPIDIDALLQNLVAPQQRNLFKEKFIVSVRNSWIPIETKDIAVFTRDNLNYLYTFTGEKFILDYNSLDDVEELLNPKLYYRANRQFIVHIDAIQSVKPDGKAKLILHLKTPLKFEVDISREKAPAFKKWLDR